MEGFEAILCLNGEAPAEEAIRPLWEQAQFRLAADGAVNWLEPIGLEPDLVLGDLDSQELERFPQVKRLEVKDQSQTDADKALVHIEEQGYTKILLFGALGGRADMSLYSLFLLLRYRHLQLELRNGPERIFRAERRAEIEAPIGARISFLPLGGTVSGLNLEGVQWLLKDASLDPSGILSASNRVTESPVRLSYHEGDLLVFLAPTSD